MNDVIYRVPIRCQALFQAFYSVDLLRPPNNLMRRYYELLHFTAKGPMQSENKHLPRVTQAACLQCAPSWHSVPQEERIKKAHVHQ